MRTVKSGLARNARILVVDDDKSIRVSLRAILEREGYVVDLAASGQEAVKKSQCHAYNVFLLDIRLPDIEGVELLKLMNDSVPKTRKIMMTGYPSMKNAIASVNYGADAYLVKPFEVDKLLGTVKTQLMMQEDDEAFSEDKVSEFIKTKVKKLAPISHV